MAEPIVVSSTIATENAALTTEEVKSNTSAVNDSVPEPSSASSTAENVTKDDQPASAVPPSKRKVKKKKFALLLSFSGKGNRGFPTIEEYLFKALYEEGMIQEDDLFKPNNFWFQRAARTDKGVSAVRQMCSIFLPLDDEGEKSLPDRLNARLPDQIRVTGLRRSIKSFDAKKACDCRTYSYTLPTFAFAHADEPTDSSFRMSEERRSEVNGYLGMYCGTHNFFNYTSRRDSDDKSCNRYIISFTCDPPFTKKRPSAAAGSGDSDAESVEEYEFVTCHVKGQSFVLHQIRKMIGMVISTIRGHSTKERLVQSWRKERMDVPMAPGLGLLLEKAHFHVYDKKYGKDHALIDTWDEDCENRINEFKEQFILPEIIDTEIKEKSMLQWIRSLQLHDFEALGSDIQDRDKSSVKKRKLDDADADDDDDMKKSTGEEEEGNGYDSQPKIPKKETSDEDDIKEINDEKASD